MVSFLLGLLLPVLTLWIGLKYQFPKDMLIPKKKFVGRNKWQRLNSKGKWYVFTSLLILFLVEIGLIAKGIEDTKHNIVKVQNNKTVYVPKIIKDTQIVKEKTFISNNDPLIDLLANPSYSIAPKPDSLYLTFSVGSVNDQIAYRVRDRLIYFGVFENKLFLDKKSNSEQVFNESQTITKNKGLYIKYPFVIQPNAPIDTQYFYFKVLYSNKESNGKEMRPLRKLYYDVQKRGHPYSSLQEVNNDTYIRLKSLLSKKGYW